jgi:hypothetical protein
MGEQRAARQMGSSNCSHESVRISRQAYRFQGEQESKVAGMSGIAADLARSQLGPREPRRRRLGTCKLGSQYLCGLCGAITRARENSDIILGILESKRCLCIRQ